jgi:hypothetical protein
MFKCEGCGKQFESSQAFGSHRNHCPGKAMVVRQAEAVVRESGFRPLTLDPRPLTLDPRPWKLATISESRPKTLDPRPLTPQDSRPPVHQIKAELDDLEVRAKLKKRQQYIDRTPWRIGGIVLAIVAVVMFFWAGGKVKLPFFGEVE